MLTSRLLLGGGVIFLIQNILVLVTFLLVFFRRLTNETFDASDATIVDIFFYSFYIDIIAFLVLGVGLLTYRFGIGGQPESIEEQPALIGGLCAILWAVLAILWRHVLPRKASESAIELFVGNTGAVDDVLLYIRLTIIFLLIGTVLFFVTLLFVKKFFEAHAAARQVELVETKKHPALGTLVQAAAANMVFNLIIFGPLVPGVMGGDWSGLNSDDASVIIALTLFIKLIAVPILMIVGAFGIIKSSLGMLNPFRSLTEAAGSGFGSDPLGLATDTLSQPVTPPVKANEPPVCKDCGQPGKFIEQYDRHYCYDCKEYL